MQARRGRGCGNTFLINAFWSPEHGLFIHLKIKLARVLTKWWLMNARAEHSWELWDAQQAAGKPLFHDSALISGVNRPCCTPMFPYEVWTPVWNTGSFWTVIDYLSDLNSYPINMVICYVMAFQVCWTIRQRSHRFLPLSGMVAIVFVSVMIIQQPSCLTRHS